MSRRRTLKADARARAHAPAASLVSAVAAALVAMLPLVPAAAARPGSSQPAGVTPLVEWRGAERRMAGGGVSMDQAIAMAERRFKARVVRAGVSESNGRRVYVLRLLSEQGRVWTVRVDADSGATN